MIMSQKDKISEIKTKAKRCIVDRKAANAIIDILCYSQDDDLSVALVAVRALQRIFVHYLSTDQMTIVKVPTTGEDVKKEDKLAGWLQEQYETACNAMLDKLDFQGTKIQEAAIAGLLKLIETEKKHPRQPDAYPLSLLQSVVSKLLSDSGDMTEVISRLSEMEWEDDRIHLLRAVKECVKKVPVKERSEQLLKNAMAVLENIDIPDEEDDESDKKKRKEEKKAFTGCVMAILKSQLTPSLYRRVLKRMDERIIPFMLSPLILADFLTEAYNVGGTISLLALNGLFILIHRYNLNYPDFYTKFYNLLDESIFMPEFQAKFFHLADLFLSSSHLPAYLVAAFIKRFSRLALLAPAPSACVCIVLVLNLLVRHPSCEVMVKREDLSVDCDPFLADETDPAKTKALDSMLWEIKTLQNSFSPSVVELARKINHPVKQEIPLDDYLQMTSEMMVEKQKKKLKKEFPFNHEHPTSLFPKNFPFTLE